MLVIVSCVFAWLKKQDKLEYTANLGWVGRAASSRTYGLAHPKRQTLNPDCFCLVHPCGCKSSSGLCHRVKVCLSGWLSSLHVNLCSRNHKKKNHICICMYIYTHTHSCTCRPLVCVGRNIVVFMGAVLCICIKLDNDTQVHEESAKF